MEQLLNTKNDLLASLKCKRVINYDRIFIASDATGIDCKKAEDFVYGLNMKEENTPYTSVLMLNPGIYVGDAIYASRLKEAFGGEVKRTEYRHIAEWKWISPIGALNEDAAVKAMFRMV